MKLFGPASPLPTARALAEECEQALSADEHTALAALSERFGRELTPDLEYIVLMSPEGRTHVHTNKLREGRVYADPDNLAAAAVRRASERVFARNTGEVIREAIVPVRRGDAHYAVLRVGQIVPKGSLRMSIAGALAVSAGAPAATALAVAGPAAGGAAAVTGAGVAAILATVLWRRITAVTTRFQEAARAVTGGDLTACVTGTGRDELGQMCFEFNKVVLGLQKVIQAGQAAARETRELATGISGGTDQAAGALAEVAATVDEVARGANDQAEGTRRVSEAIASMAAGVDRIVATGRRAGTTAEAADAVAREGATRAREATAAIACIERAVGDAAGAVTSLGRRGQAIGEIVGTIGEIASQTNLLALNAAIEAARAGDQGRGFAVVADEVRKLAESTQAQTGSIEALVREILDETGRAVAAMETGTREVAHGSQLVVGTSTAFGRISDAVDELAAAVAAVARTAEDLAVHSEVAQSDVASVASVSEEHASAAEEVSASTHETAAATRRVAASTDELSGAAERLGELVARFRT